jgi:hypothetical protein
MSQPRRLAAIPHASQPHIQGGFPRPAYRRSEGRCGAAGYLRKITKMRR